MKEIKFRAWDKKKKVMREVAVLHFNRLTKEISGVEYWTEDLYLKSLHINYINVNQYTGLKDKKGVEIYDGDCFRGKSGVKIVKYKEGAFVTEYKFNIRGYEEVSILPLMVTSSESVVIGNIYENPELLEVRNG